ncbi:MAG: hypothetical protein IIC76_07750 [Bacteroidetes bacterium]|nr:hypothetical protein [Bacteroidota bacterium]
MKYCTLTVRSYFNETHINGNYLSVTINGNTLIVVGQDVPKAAISIGTKKERS